jgi:predicted secreted hydrolase
VKSIPYSGWRWVAIQLDNNTEMAFATSIDKKNKTNLFLFKDEQKIEIKNTEYTIEDIDYWLDPEINYKYPVKMRLKIPNLKTDLEISTLIKKYQLTQNKKTMEYKNLETSCLVKGSFTGQAVTGRAQLEIVDFIKK